MGLFFGLIATQWDDPVNVGAMMEFPKPEWVRHSTIVTQGERESLVRAPVAGQALVPESAATVAVVAVAQENLDGRFFVFEVEIPGIDLE